MALNLSDRIGRAEGAMTAPIGNDIVILGTVSDNYIALDEIGRRIWELIESPTTCEALCQRLGQEFSGDRAAIQADVLAFLAQLQTEGIVHVVDDHAA